MSSRLKAVRSTRIRHIHQYLGPALLIGLRIEARTSNRAVAEPQWILEAQAASDPRRRMPDRTLKIGRICGQPSTAAVRSPMRWRFSRNLTATIVLPPPKMSTTNNDRVCERLLREQFEQWKPATPVERKWVVCRTLARRLPGASFQRFPAGGFHGVFGTPHLGLHLAN